ncbi:MAG: hypothetical protein ACFCUE_07555 [Candidatus Bathyarchaeia archaeon]
MSETEAAQTTISRLLTRELSVVKDTGALANIHVGDEFPQADALKAYDGQVTVALAESSDQKLELSGLSRKRNQTLRVNVWSTDFSHSEKARSMRNKLVEEVNRVIRQNRNRPNQTLYNFAGCINGGQTCKAFQGTAEHAPGDSSWVELSSLDYPKLWYSDDTRYQNISSQNGEYAVLLLGFKLESRRNTVKKIVLNFEGYTESPNGDSMTVKVWNSTELAWQNQRTQGGNLQDHTATLTIENTVDYIDNADYVWMLARTTDSSSESVPAVLFCDYASCTVTVNGVTYCDVSGYRQIDHSDVKPFIYRTEFTVKTWYFEKIGE